MGLGFVGSFSPELELNLQSVAQAVSCISNCIHPQVRVGQLYGINFHMIKATLESNRLRIREQHMLLTVDGTGRYCEKGEPGVSLTMLLDYSPQGTAVFWYNLFASGEGDYSTRHAACPVLVGNKWGKYE